MASKIDLIQKAYAYLREYNGENPYITQIKYRALKENGTPIDMFQAEYIVNSHNLEPKRINKIIRLARWYAEKKQEDWGVDFLPNKLLVTYLMGETSDFYHFYAKYRQSMDTQPMFIPKKAILTDFLATDFNELEVDFSKYNEKSGRTLMKHQETAVKFLVSREKCILADEMGSGKSTSAIVGALESGYKHVLIICPASVKSTWKRELEIYVPEDEITIVSGSKWDDKKFTIINYDILDNFYEIPTEIRKVRQTEVDDDGKMHYTYVDKEVVSRKKDVIQQAMENSQLFQSNFDLIIVDEAHRLSNSTSGRTKIVSDLFKRLQPEGVYMLTGTPITNRPINFFNILKLIDAPIANDWQNYVRSYCDGKQIFPKGERDKYTRYFLGKKGKRSWYELTSSEKDELKVYLENNCKKIWLTSGESNLDELQEVVKPYYLRRLKEDFGSIVDKRVRLISYRLTGTEESEYENLWNEYVEARKDDKAIEDLEKYKKITEGTMMRQWLSTKMVNRTVRIANKHLQEGDKVLIICCFDDELYKFKEIFGDKAVTYNGKMTPKQKDKAEKAFMEDDDIRVFIGNIQACGLGLTLTSATVCIFNNFDWVSGNNLQAEDRIHRLSQKKNVTIYYQVFKDTFFEEMFQKVRGKQDIIDQIIVKDENK